MDVIVYGLAIFGAISFIADVSVVVFCLLKAKEYKED